MDYGIFSPKFGLAETVPGILLSEAFMASGSKNVHERYGTYQRLAGRLPDLYDDDGELIACPVEVYAITAVNQGTKTFTVGGNHATTLSANCLTDDDGNPVVRINGSTGNDGLYTVSSITDSGADTEIVVVEAIADATADGNLHAGGTPILKYCRHVSRTDVEYLLLGTAYHILLWDETTKTLTIKFTCATPSLVNRWEIISHQYNVYATNNADLVQWWNVDSTPSGNFVDLDDVGNGLDLDGGVTYLTAARHIVSYQGYLLFGHTTEGGTVYPQRVRWSTKDDPTDYDETGTGDTGAKDFDSTPGALMGFGKYANTLVVAKTEDMNIGWLTTDAVVFEWVEAQIKVGCIGADTIVNDKAGRLYWMASDQTIRELNTAKPLSVDQIDPTMRMLNISVAEYFQATFIEELNQIWFAVATASSEENDTILAIDVEGGRWYKHTIPVRAFGVRTRQSAFTYDTLPYETYDAWGAEWLVYDTAMNIVGFKIALASDYNGYTYNLNSADKDAGEDFTGTMIFRTRLADEHIALDYYKRINNGIILYFNRLASDTGDVTVDYRLDGQRTWHNLGTVSLVDSDNPEYVSVHVPCDLRARAFEFRLTSTEAFKFLGMYVPDFELDGRR